MGPIMRMAGLSMKRLVIHSHVFAREIYLPMEVIYIFIFISNLFSVIIFYYFKIKLKLTLRAVDVFVFRWTGGLPRSSVQHLANPNHADFVSIKNWPFNWGNCRCEWRQKAGGAIALVRLGANASPPGGH